MVLNPTAEFEIMDCRDINTINKQFDAAICGFGLPYISNTRRIKSTDISGSFMALSSVGFMSFYLDFYYSHHLILLVLLVFSFRRSSNFYWTAEQSVELLL